MTEGMRSYPVYIPVTKEGLSCREITNALDSLTKKDSCEYNEAIADAINTVIDLFREKEKEE